MKIIILGPPGSGKGTQSQLLEKQYNIPHISTGDILRKNIIKNQKINILINKKISQGILIDDNLIINLIKKRIQKKDCIKGFILDGFPRTLYQSKKIKENNIKINYIIELSLKKNIIYERILGRRLHPKSGRTYHVIYHPPKSPEIDDITKEPLVIRKDDNINTINRRCIEYQNIKKTILNFFMNDIHKNKIKYLKINSDQNIESINKQIKKIL
ncbi:adenylate kinase family protein [Buchnera aphidicola]|uniref:adenylate kinase family protein n=1 Tax=Buchnera aphidicola TaxID=9 RepID=UPI00346457F4